MNDIVERLRQGLWVDCPVEAVMFAAADEIERLRGLLGLADEAEREMLQVTKAEIVNLGSRGKP